MSLCTHTCVCVHVCVCACVCVYAQSCICALVDCALKANRRLYIQWNLWQKTPYPYFKTICLEPCFSFITHKDILRYRPPIFDHQLKVVAEWRCHMYLHFCAANVQVIRKIIWDGIWPSACVESRKGNNSAWHISHEWQGTQLQRLESPRATLTWHASKYVVYKLHQRFILKKNVIFGGVYVPCIHLHAKWDLP